MPNVSFLACTKAELCNPTVFFCGECGIVVKNFLNSNLEPDPTMC